MLPQFVPIESRNLFVLVWRAVYSSYYAQHSFSCSSLETSGLTRIGYTSDTSSFEKVTRRRLKLDVSHEEPAQFRSGETNRIGCSGDSGGELKWFDERW